MKVKCIKHRDYHFNITKKTYEVISEHDGDYYLINDDSEKFPYPKRWFKPLAEIRNEIIDNTGYINLYFKEYFKPLSEIRAETINKLLEDEN